MAFTQAQKAEYVSELSSVMFRPVLALVVPAPYHFANSLSLELIGPIHQPRRDSLKRSIGLSGTDQNFTDIIVLNLDYIFAEANRALLSFEKRYNKTVSKVILVGGGAALKGLSELAKQNFNTEAVAGNPFGKVATPAFLERVLNETGPEFAVAIGLALRELQEQG